MNKVVSIIFVGVIKFYQLVISPYLMPACRYTPSCSQYSIDAIKKYGPFKGGALALKRIISCNPWGGNGHHPVP